MRTLALFVCTLIIGGVLGSCSSTKSRYSASNPCRTTLSGTFESPLILGAGHDPGARPLAVFRKRGEVFSRAGRIVSNNDSGVVMDLEIPFKRSTSLHFIPRKDLICLIDSTNTIVDGSVPESIGREQWSVRFSLQPKGDTDHAPIRIEFTDRETSTYCVEPGEYDVINLRFIFHGRVDEVIEPKHLTMTIKENVNNYVGEMHFLTMVDSTSAMHFRVSTSHPGMLFPFLSAGAVIGLGSWLVDALKPDSHPWVVFRFKYMPSGAQPTQFNKHND